MTTPEDRASALEDLDREIAIRTYRKPVGIHPMGKCHYCDEPLDVGLFCPDDDVMSCRVEWENMQKTASIRGQAYYILILVNNPTNKREFKMGSDDRLVAVETEVSWIKQSLLRTESALTQVAEDMHKIALNQVQQAEDRKLQEALKQEVDALREDVAAVKDKLNELKIASLERRNKEQSDRLKDILKLVVAVGSAVLIAWLLMHLGLSAPETASTLR